MAKSFIHFQYSHLCFYAGFAVYHILESIFFPKTWGSLVFFISLSHPMIAIDSDFPVVFRPSLSWALVYLPPLLHTPLSAPFCPIFLSVHVLESVKAVLSALLLLPLSLRLRRPVFALCALRAKLSVARRPSSITLPLIISLPGRLYAPGLNFAAPRHAHPSPRARLSSSWVLFPSSAWPCSVTEIGANSNEIKSHCKT